jgi:hypothetical protein
MTSRDPLRTHQLLRKATFRLGSMPLRWPSHSHKFVRQVRDVMPTPEEVPVQKRAAPDADVRNVRTPQYPRLGVAVSHDPSVRMRSCQWP